MITSKQSLQLLGALGLALPLGLWACAPSKDERQAPAPAPAALTASEGFLASRAPAYDPPGLTPAQIRSRQDRGEAILLVDVRSKMAYDASHIPGAISLPWRDLTKGHRQLPKDRLMALYCT